MLIEKPERKMAEVEIGDIHTRIKARGTFIDKDALDFVPTKESLFLFIDTPNYDGPLDLLLHLIKKHSMDIFDIPIVIITEKYLAALDEMQSLNLDVAGEFILMAATLMHIKSKMLLPKEEQKVDDEENEEDPRKELVRRLLQYQAFKEVAEEVKQWPHLGRDFFRNNLELLPMSQPEGEVKLAKRELFELLEALAITLKKTEDKVVHTITRDRISISARIHDLMDFCGVRGQFTFFDAVGFFPVYERSDVIVTFLALLEMTRLKLIRIQQGSPRDLAFMIVKENFYASQENILQNLEAIEDSYEQK